ncbi:MAG: SURF1 family protein [Chromatiales bacterium]|nr:SURF1 family protein [Chromatiales bacterium]
MGPDYTEPLAANCHGFAVEMAFRVQIGPYRFRFPSLWPALLTLATLTLLLQLGGWQWQRAGEKDALLADFQRGGESGIPRFADVSAAQFDSLRFATVQIEGRFERSERIYLDNRTHEGRLGYQVLGVFRARGHQAALLVNLGWLPLAQGGREILPATSLPDGDVSFPARLKPISDPILALGTALDVRDGGRLVMPVMDRDVVSEWLQEPLLEVEALVDPSAPFGYARAWQAHYDIPPVKHRAYAFQWFAMALAVVLIFILVNTRRVVRPGPENTHFGENDD